MKDGTELTHYGVKGMKWGKRLFGKVKGVFGKDPVAAQQQAAREAAANNAAKWRDNKYRLEDAADDRRTRAQSDQRFYQDAYRRLGTGRTDFEVSDPKYFTQKLKRNSKKFNR